MEGSVLALGLFAGRGLTELGTFGVRSSVDEPADVDGWRTGQLLLGITVAVAVSGLVDMVTLRGPSRSFAIDPRWSEATVSVAAATCGEATKGA